MKKNRTIKIKVGFINRLGKIISQDSLVLRGESKFQGLGIV
jgi:hypothetical protein